MTSLVDLEREEIMNIVLKEIVKRRKEERLLDHISKTLESGKIYRLQCCDRVVSQTLMNAICGLEVLDSGGIYINGELVQKGIAPAKNIGKMIGEPTFILGYTGMENLQAIASVHQCVTDQGIRKAMEMVGLNPDDSGKYGTYSDEKRKLLGIASAVMENPDIVMIDEPVGGLSEMYRKKIEALILAQKSRGALCIIACQKHLELDKMSDEVIQISQGRLII